MQYMTRKQAIKYLGIGQVKFDKFVKAGMPSVPFGKQKRYKADDIDEWLEQGGGDLSEGEPAGRGDADNGKAET